MTDREKDFASTLAKLQHKYLTSFADKADALANALSRCQAGDAHAVKEIETIVHRLAGTAGSFEILDVSEVAVDLDKRLNHGTTPDEISDELAELIELLHARSRV